MANTNDELYEQAKEAIGELYNDKTVSKEDAIGNLNGLIEECQMLIDCLQD